MDRPSSLLAVFVFAAALGFSGCNQGAGDRCEVTRDCQSGYICVKQSSDPVNGTCTPPNQTVPAADSGTATDAAADVASADLAADVASELPAEAAAETAAETPDAAVETSEDAPVDTAPDTAVDSTSDAATAETGG